MAQYIDKDTLVAEIDKRMIGYNTDGKHFVEYNTVKKILDILGTLEVKEVGTWHLQEKEDIYDAVKDWSLHTFACLMKDGSIQKFIGNLDEDYEGHINVHIGGVNDDYDDVDDIVKWIEIT